MSRCVRKHRPTRHYHSGSGLECGRVDWVQIDLGEDAGHLISPQERLRVAMARQ